MCCVLRFSAIDIQYYLYLGVFAPGRDIEIAVKVLYRMKVCNQAVKNNVIFSLVLALSHPPKYHQDLSVYLHKIKSNPPVCQSFLSFDGILGSRTHRNYDNQAVSVLPFISAT